MVDFDKYCIARRKPTATEVLLYMEEVNSCCPICGKPLVLEKKGRTKKLCEIAHVFPNSPTDYEKNILKEVRVAGENSESPLNKIALCKDCHDEYDELKTVESYDRMYDLKERLRAELDAKKGIVNYNIEDELVTIISVLGKLTSDDYKTMQKLELKALTINQKIEDDYFLLKNKIEQDTLQFFLFIQNKFKCLGEEAASFDTIAYNVKHAYCSLRDKKLDKGQIYDQMVAWFQNKTHCRRESCEKMVAFFVQDCEIYEELPK